MKRGLGIAAAVLVLFLSLSLWQGGERQDLGDLSLQFFSHLFQSPAARDVFGWEEDEAVAVFGEEFETAYL